MQSPVGEAPVEAEEIENKLEQGEPLNLEELLQISIFQGVPKPLLEKNLGAVALRRYHKGDQICREGEQGSTAFYIVKGSVKVTINTPFTHVKTAPHSRGFKGFVQKMTSFLVGHGEDPRPEDTISFIPIDGPVDLSYHKPVATLGAGTLFGEMTCLSFYPRSATVVAEEDCEILEMLQNILQICQRNPEFKKKLDDTYRERALITHLKSVPIFKTLSEDFLNRLKVKVELVSFEPGSSIFSEGDVADALYLVRLGFVKVTKNFPGGQMVLSYLPRGSYFGEMGLLQRWEHEKRRSLRLPVQIPAVWTPESQADGLPVRIIVLSNHGALIEADNPLTGDKGALQFSYPVGGEQIHCQVRVVRSSEATDSPNRMAVEFTELSEQQKGQVRQIYQQMVPAGIRTASCTALDHVELVKIKSEDVLMMLEQFPEIEKKIQQTAESRETANRYLLNVPRDLPLDDFLDQGLIQAQNLLVIDLAKCTRCDACTEACAATHDGVTRLIREGLRYDNYLVATSCRQCMDPLCMVGCPVGSIRRKDSLEILIEDWCIGCGLCAKNCPYGNINMQPFEALEEDEKNPGVQKAVLRKKATTCDLCTQLEEPSCVYACPHDAAHRIDPKEFFGFQQKEKLEGVVVVGTMNQKD